MIPEAIILSGYGINADAELAEAFRAVGACPERVHIADVVADPERLLAARILAFPGGFSFGDHLGSGQVLASICRRSLRPALERFAAEGGLIIGICNGFQTLAKMGMLPNRDGAWTREVTLVHNESGRFVDGWFPVRFERSSRGVWTRGLEDLSLPVRHGEGRFVARDEAVLDALESEGLIALRYGPGDDPNGSARSVAGICDPTGRILGLMPHPEAFLVRENSPDRRRGRSGPTGLELFSLGVKAAMASA
ncbi:MAG: phosphoribosylformylglycinamidine synthase subunit PurQ [Spirochaetaceae bacterium]|nr:phosphoribosylformylglycinamidine synthase subunit PurQ [Spirochaetaceae bacterium]